MVPFLSVFVIGARELQVDHKAVSCPPVCQSLSVCRPVCLSVYLSACLDCLSVCLAGWLADRLACLSLCLHVWPVCLFACLACLSACLSVCLSACLSVCLSVCLVTLYVTCIQCWPFAFRLTVRVPFIARVCAKFSTMRDIRARSHSHWGICV